MTELEVSTATPVRVNAFVGDDLSGYAFQFDLTNAGGYPLDDIIIAASPDWLEIDGVQPTLIPPYTTVPLTLKFSATADALDETLPPTVTTIRIPFDEGVAGGHPVHDVWVAPTEVTNTQFEVFLNNAYADAVGEDPSERSYYMYFDTDSGDVYINNAMLPEVGTDGAGTLLYDAAIGRIQFDGDAYVVQSGFDSHPVVGATWFGAIKYCNGLSIANGLPLGQRAYIESVTSDEWRPVTAPDGAWLLSLDGARRQSLADEYLGYRLPMDDETAGASLYNEWYKFAAWDEWGGAEHAYGFGRDVVVGADANFLDSGDPFDNDTTPTAYYDGTDHGGVFATTEDDNAYGLADLTGNVAEWMQEFLDLDDPSQRAVRGGSFAADAASLSLRTDERSGTAPGAAGASTGFRVARAAAHLATITITDNLTSTGHDRFVLLNLREPFRLTPYVDPAVEGMYRDATALVGVGEMYTVLNRSASDMDWEVETTSIPAWIDLSEPTSGTLTGAPSPGDNIDVTVATNAEAANLGPGLHVATIIFRNLTTARTFDRTVTLTVDEPIAVTDPAAQFTGPFEGPFVPDGFTYTLTSRVPFELDYEVSADQTWLTLTSNEPLSGTLAPDDELDFDVALGAEVDALGVGDYEGTVTFIFTDPDNGGLSADIDRAVTLTVEDPIQIDQEFEPWDISGDLDPLPSQIYTLTNNHGQTSIDVVVTVDQSWVDITNATPNVLPGLTEDVTATLNSDVLALSDGLHTAIISVEDTLTGVVQTRTISLAIQNALAIAPASDFAVYGPAGGPFTRPSRVYTITNVDDELNLALDWEVSLRDPADWLLIDGDVMATGTLADGDHVHVVITIDADHLVADPADAVLELKDVTDGEESLLATRTVSLALVTPQLVPSIEERPVAGTTLQPGGPTYEFHMGRYDVTNAEFVVFLNDALANPDSERGYYMFFDTTTGNVYVNDAQAGASGSDPGERTTKMFAPGVAGRIEYAGGVYQTISPDDADHPITGVSWYGAIKFCNWLTLDQGLGPNERCYTEDTDADENLPGWHPISVATSDWSARDLQDTERVRLIGQYLGYRLPMDNGVNNADPDIDGADNYNEWYKAAAWSPQAGADTLFGFGRNTIADGDANYVASSDPFEPGTTPVGFYDGTLYNPGGDGPVGDGSEFQTNSNDNTWGLFDLSGNVYMWMQGRYNTHPTSIRHRVVRGGSYNASTNALETTTRNAILPPNVVNGEVGFRTVRTQQQATGDIDGNRTIDLDDWTHMVECLADGPGMVVSDACRVFDFDGDTDVDVRDVAVMQSLFAP